VQYLNVRVPIGTDAIVAYLYDNNKTLLDDAFVSVAVGSTPVNLAFRAGGAASNLSVVTPALAGAGDFRIAVTPLASDGSVILNNNHAAPISVRVYAPAGLVVSRNGSDVPTAGVRDPGVSATFRYSGAPFANPMTVAAIRNNATITAQIFPAVSPRMCANLGNTRTATVAEHNPVSKGFFLQMSIAGGPKQRVQLDTGSMGLLIDAPYITKADRSQLIGPGQFGEETLKPRDITLKGNYYLAPVTLFGNGATIGTTVPMEVLVVTTSCTKENVCTPDTGTHYLGIGFGRPTPAPGTGFLKSPADNAVLQLTDMVQGSMHPGYILGKDSLAIGINETNAAGYALATLKPFVGRPGDWQTPPGCIRFGSDPFICGNMLLDIGIGSMFVDVARPDPMPTQISIAAPNISAPSLAYSFAYPVSPDATPPAPSGKNSAAIDFGNPQSPPFFNTGRGPLAVKSYLFDSACGRAGFRSYSSKE
jgi:hypothetical protein